jgi:putative tricarboxylic transport membrane protein
MRPASSILLRQTRIMHSSDNSSEHEPKLTSNRTMEIAVSLLFLVVSAVFIYDSLRLGIVWHDNEGPASGYFPFYIAVLMAGASIINLISALRDSAGDGGDTFVTKPAFMRVLAVLVPTIVYVGLIQILGIYVASGLFIIAFMLAVGREGILKSICVGVGVPLALFVMFEIWFLVPLPKGPLEQMLGY